jgi:protoporphyrinogen oxidase
MTILILGGGLAGISCSYHLGHDNCMIIERNSYLGGHAATHRRDSAFWDEGPHVSFTKHSEVRELLNWSAGGDVLDYPTNVGNYFAGHWIPHPAQSHLHAVPEPLAERCYSDFIANQNNRDQDQEPENYQQWLDKAFGTTFSRTFPHAYTRKYWTCDPSDLSTDWVGNRVFKPDLDTIAAGYVGKPIGQTHYISSVRYPAHGGFGAFINGFGQRAKVIHDEVTAINLESKELMLASGRTFSFEKLISTIPLDQLITLITNAPSEVRSAAATLRCTSLLLVNILGIQEQPSPYHWLYVYDEDMYSTRITQTHLLSSSNTPSGLAGLQVEVYASPYRPFPGSNDEILAKVVDEVLSMGLMDEIRSTHFHYVPYANVIFDNQRRNAQDTILSFLAYHGLIREHDDLEPMTDWQNAHGFRSLPQLALAGRFGQWKYFWSDDCILRGAQIARANKLHR